MLEQKKTELNPLIQNIWEQAKEKAAVKKLKFIVQQTDAVANTDSKWTQEALFNIVDNAIKYTDSGSITIGVSEYDMFVRIDVCDTGKGIPQEEQTKIFGRFYRGMSVRSEEGVGIGLYLAREGRQ